MNRLFDRSAIKTKPLSERVNKLGIECGAVDAATCSISLSAEAAADVATAAVEIREARKKGAPVILAFGAHSIKNGLSGVLARLMRNGYVTHFATNGAGVIHDWEFAFQGWSGEDVRRYAAEGQFGIWEETGLYINLALAIGAWRGLGYGEAVGRMILDEGLAIPSAGELRAAILACADSGVDAASLEKAAAAADLSALLLTLRSGGTDQPETYSAAGDFLRIPHPWKEYSLSAAAVSTGIPFTSHPMFGHDIIYTHPANRGAPIGRTAERDFLSFVESVSRLEGGVYLSVGSAVMSPMIFEKALSMSRNVARLEGRTIQDFSIHVVDLAKSTWDWTNGREPPQDDPAYYLRFCKTFSRMGGRMHYVSADNRAWLSALALDLGSA
jgi:hypothetical protein